MEKEKQREIIRNYFETGDDAGVKNMLRSWFIHRPAEAASRMDSSSRPDTIEQELEALWERSLQAPSFDRSRIDSAFSTWKEHIGYRIPTPPMSKFRRSWIRHCIQIAAVLMLIVGSWYVSERITIRKASEQYVTVVAPPGQRLDITLQDGTTVCLNSGTKLEYPILFDANRRVRLSGEALFDVERDPEHPFIVETFACEVEVLGTRFNVIADEADRTFSTALLRGRLKVTDVRNPAEQILMNPNDLVYLNDGSLSLKSIDDPDDYLWAEGFINLRGSSFAELMIKLEKTYGAKIVIDRKIGPTLEVVRGRVPTSMGLDYALRTLQDLVPFEYVRESDTNVIRIK